MKVTERVQARSTKLLAGRETRRVVRGVRQGTSDEGLGWSKLLQQECDYHFCAGVEVMTIVSCCRETANRCAKNALVCGETVRERKFASDASRHKKSARQTTRDLQK